jgi:transcriptional regulator with XRE-family HTH domain
MLNEALRLIRVFHDISQKDLACRLEISAPYLSEIEKGRKQPTLDLINRYAAEFKMPPSSILFFSEHTKDGSGAATLKNAMCEKALALLSFIAARSGRDVA